MKYLSNLIFCVLIMVYTLNLNAQENYTYKDVQGIWIYDANTVYHDNTELWGKEFYIFKNNCFLRVSTNNGNLCRSKKIELKTYGFTNTFGESEIENVFDSGKYLTFVDSRNRFDSWCCFFVEYKESLEFFYHECSYLERLPKTAQLVLFHESLIDSINYARQFLDYDICSIQSNECQLLDSLQNPIMIIPQGDIVVVRNTEGDLLQVEYEDIPEHFVTGYIRREHLQFVVEKEDEKEDK